MTRLLFFLLAVAALFGVSSTANASLSSGLPGGPVGSPVISTVDFTNRSTIEVVGDSITVRSYKALPAQLPGERIAVNAQSGSNTSQSIGRLETQLKAGARLPARLVMATGANDVFSPGVVGVQVKRLLALVQAQSPTTRVYWVDVSVLRPGYLFQDRVNSAKVNQQIRAYCVGSCTVISWAGFLSKVQRSTYVDRGGVHPTTAGQQAWAKLIAGGIS
jgi:lysophospholipase L1-like esterase